MKVLPSRNSKNWSHGRDTGNLCHKPLTDRVSSFVLGGTRLRKTAEGVTETDDNTVYGHRVSMKINHLDIKDSSLKEDKRPQNSRNSDTVTVEQPTYSHSDGHK